MNKEDLQIFKQKLEEEMELLVGELGELGRIVDERTGDWEPTPEEKDVSTADENLNADRFEGFEERASTLDTLEFQLEQVKSALSKIESGKYGICESCGEQIEHDRLMANPSAITCKAHME